MLEPTVWGLLLSRFVADVTQFVDGNVLESLAALFQLLVDLQRGFLHAGVRQLRAAIKEKITAARDSRVTVMAVKAEA